MLKYLGRFLLLSLKFIFTTLIVMVPVCMIAVFILLWRIASAPLEIGFAKSYVMEALSDEMTGNHAVMEGVYLHWPDFKDSIHLVLDEGKVLNKDDKIILSVRAIALTLSKAGLLRGQLLPTKVTLKEPNLRIIRTVDGGIDIGIGSTNFSNTDSDEDTEAMVRRVLSYLAEPSSENYKDSPLSELESLEIDNARLMLEDHINGLSWFLPNFGGTFRRNDKGLFSRLGVSLPDVRGETSEVHFLLSYFWKLKRFELITEILNLDTMILAGKFASLDILRDQDLILNAELRTSFGHDLLPGVVSLKARSEGGRLYHPSVTKKGLPYKDFRFGLSYDRYSKNIKLTDTRITLRDVTFQASANLQNDNFEKITGLVSLKVDTLKQASIDPLWPEFLRGDNSEEWLVDKMADGTFRDLWANIDIVAELVPLDQGAGPAPAVFKSPDIEEDALFTADLTEDEKVWDFDITDLQAGYAYENMTVDYRAPLFPVTKAKGTGKFDYNTDILSAHIEDAYLGDLHVRDAKVVLGEVVAVGKGTAELDIDFEGDLQEVFAYLSEEPINMNKDKGMDISQVKGSADLRTRLAFDTNKKVLLEEMEIESSGILTNVFIPDVVHTLDLTGGPFKLELKDKKVTVTGAGELNKRPIDLVWSEYLESEGKPYKSQTNAKITADPNIRKALGINLDDFLQGSIGLDVVYTGYRNNRSVADVKVDATPARFFVAPFDYNKPPGKAGSARFKAVFRNEVLQELQDLTAQAEQFDLKKTTLGFKKYEGETYLHNGKVSRFTLGETDAALDFTIQDDGVVKILFDGDFLDLRPFLNVDEVQEDYTQPATMISVKAKQMRTSENETVRAVEMYSDIDEKGRFNQLEIDAKVGEGDFYLRFKPNEDGKRKFVLEATDAGATLKAFYIYTGMEGGEIRIFAEPIEGGRDRNFSGTAEITNFKVTKAPAMSKLLSILSLPGMIEVLRDDGLDFRRLEAKVDWLYRPEGSLIILEDGRTSGNSLGLTFDGEFDNAKRLVDIEGTVIPLSGVNEIIGSIPLVGDIITGGSGSLFAATYQIKGKMDDPKISTNPLSVLAPGLLRRILFE